MRALTIGRAAREAGIDIKVVLLNERSGLIEPPKSRVTGFTYSIRWPHPFHQRGVADLCLSPIKIAKLLTLSPDSIADTRMSKTWFATGLRGCRGDRGAARAGVPPLDSGPGGDLLWAGRAYPTRPSSGSCARTAVIRLAGFDGGGSDVILDASPGRPSF